MRQGSLLSLFDSAMSSASCRTHLGWDELTYRYGTSRYAPFDNTYAMDEDDILARFDFTVPPPSPPPDITPRDPKLDGIYNRISEAASVGDVSALAIAFAELRTFPDGDARVQ